MIIARTSPEVSGAEDGPMLPRVGSLDVQNGSGNYVQGLLHAQNTDTGSVLSEGPEGGLLRTSLRACQ